MCGLSLISVNMPLTALPVKSGSRVIPVAEVTSRIRPKGREGGGGGGERGMVNTSIEEMEGGAGDKQVEIGRCSPHFVP